MFKHLEPTHPRGDNLFQLLEGVWLECQPCETLGGGKKEEKGGRREEGGGRREEGEGRREEGGRRRKGHSTFHPILRKICI